MEPAGKMHPYPTVVSDSRKEKLASADAVADYGKIDVLAGKASFGTQQ